MTPTEQDEELRDEIDERLETLLGYLGQRDDRDNWWGFDTNVGTLEDEIEGTLDSIIRLITADRKRVELEARIDEMKLHRHEWELFGDRPPYEGESVSLPILLAYHHDRIAELKAQQEEAQ